MGGGNPLKSNIGKIVTGGVLLGPVGAGLMAAHVASKSDTVKGMMGKETKAEKAAKEEQRSASSASQADAASALEERRKRMELKKQGRGSLLSGTELGTNPSTTSTLG